jgi:hypothetical protein
MNVLGAIIWEKWEEEIQTTPRPGATTTRHAAVAALHPMLQRTIPITQNANTDPHRIMSLVVHWS